MLYKFYSRCGVRIFSCILFSCLVLKFFVFLTISSSYALKNVCILLLHHFPIKYTENPLYIFSTLWRNIFFCILFPCRMWTFFLNQTFPIICMKNHSYLLFTLIEKNIFRYIITCCIKNLFHNTSPSSVLKILCTFFLRWEEIYFSEYYFHTECEHFFFNQTFPILCMKNHLHILSTLIRKNIFLYIISYNRKKYFYITSPSSVLKMLCTFFLRCEGIYFSAYYFHAECEHFFLIKLSPSYAWKIIRIFYSR